MNLKNLRWCLHCERVKEPVVQFHHGTEVEFCGYIGCDGGPLDLVCWCSDGVHGLPCWGNLDSAELALELSLSRYPSVPIEGVVYPLYADDSLPIKPKSSPGRVNVRVAKRVVSKGKGLPGTGTAAFGGRACTGSLS